MKIFKNVCHCFVKNPNTEEGILIGVQLSNAGTRRLFNFKIKPLINIPLRNISRATIVYILYNTCARLIIKR